MKWDVAGQAVTIAIASVLIAVLIVKRARAWYRPRLTVEQEQDSCREVIVCIGQHHPSEPEEYESIEEPQLMLVHEVIAIRNTASRG
jgi:hypothetical protein